MLRGEVGPHGRVAGGRGHGHALGVKAATTPKVELGKLRYATDVALTKQHRPQGGASR